MLLDVILLDAKSHVPVDARTNAQPLLAKEVFEFGICIKVRLEVLFEENIVVIGGNGSCRRPSDVGKKLGVPALLGWYPGDGSRPGDIAV